MPSDLRIEQVEDEAHKGLLRRLEGVTDASATRAAESGLARGQLVSLRLDMSAYFRRAGVNMGGTTASGDGTSQ